MEALEITQRALMVRRKTQRLYFDSEIPKRMGYLHTILVELEQDESEPWLLTHNTVHEYLAALCGMTLRRIQQIAAREQAKQEAKQLMPEAAERLDDMKERAAREIATTPPEKRMELIQEAVSTPGKITAAKLRAVKQRIMDAEIVPTHEAGPAARCCPTCHQPLP